MKYWMLISGFLLLGIQQHAHAKINFHCSVLPDANLPEGATILGVQTPVLSEVKTGWELTWSTEGGVSRMFEVLSTTIEGEYPSDYTSHLAISKRSDLNPLLLASRCREIDYCQVANSGSKWHQGAVLCGLSPHPL